MEVELRPFEKFSESAAITSARKRNLLIKISEWLCLIWLNNDVIAVKYDHQNIFKYRAVYLYLLQLESLRNL